MKKNKNSQRIKNNKSFRKISKYFNEIRDKEYEPIKEEEIIRLIKIAQSGYDKDKDTWTKEAEEAKNKIVKSFIRFVPHIVCDVIDNTHDLFMDCVNECYFTVVRCILKYDLNKKVKFVSYVNVALYNRVITYSSTNINSVRLPYGEISKRVKKQNEISSSVDYLNIFFKKDFEPIINTLSLDYVIKENENSDNLTFGDFLEGKNIYIDIYKNEMKKITLESLKCLKKRERKIIIRRFLDKKTGTLEVLSKEIGITRERVRQIQNVALNKMREYIQFYKGEAGSHIDKRI